MAYNGWSNYETWCVGLWLDNDEGAYREVRRLAEEAAGDDQEPGDFASTVKSYVEDLTEEDRPESGMVADMVNAAFSEVDWHELAEHYLNEFKS